MKKIDPQVTPCFDVSVEATNPKSPECPVETSPRVRNNSFPGVVARDRYEAVKRVAAFLAAQYSPQPEWELLSEKMDNVFRGDTVFIRMFPARDRNASIDILHVEVERK